MFVALVQYYSYCCEYVVVVEEWVFRMETEIARVPVWLATGVVFEFVGAVAIPNGPSRVWFGGWHKGAFGVGVF